MIYDLVLEGGGTKSIAFLGALQEFEARNYEIGRLLGTSAGGIAAAMLACGYTSQEAMGILYDSATQRPTFASLLAQEVETAPQVLRKGKIRELLLKHNSPLIPDIIEGKIDTLLFEALLRSPLLNPLLSFLEQGHWYSDQPLLKWLEKIFDSGEFRGKSRCFSKMTLKEFYVTTEKELSIVVSDITASHVLVLNHRTAPYCPLIWALRMSAGLPLLWEDVVWRDAWGTYLGRDISGHHIVEGEVFSPFPIELFFSNLPLVTKWLGPRQTFHVLGFTIDETIPVPHAPPQQLDEYLAAVEDLPPLRALEQIINAVLQTRNKLTIDAVERHIIHLPAKGYRMLEFHLPTKRFEALVEAGQKSTNHYFERSITESKQVTQDLLIPSSPSAIQYINDSAQAQLTYIGVVNNYNVDTGGGAFVGGDVTVGQGDFVGRDDNRA